MLLMCFLTMLGEINKRSAISLTLKRCVSSVSNSSACGVNRGGSIYWKGAWARAVVICLPNAVNNCWL